MEELAAAPPDSEPRSRAMRCFFIFVFFVVGQPAYIGLKEYLLQSYLISKSSDILTSRLCDGERLHTHSSCMAFTRTQWVEYYFLSKNERQRLINEKSCVNPCCTNSALTVPRSWAVFKFLSADLTHRCWLKNRLNGGSPSGFTKSDKHRLRKQRRIYWNSAHATQGSRNAKHRLQTRNFTCSRNLTATYIRKVDDPTIDGDSARPKVNIGYCGMSITLNFDAETPLNSGREHQSACHRRIHPSKRQKGHAMWSTRNSFYCKSYQIWMVRSSCARRIVCQP